jgi:uncharacterized membrane protein YqjE
MTKDRFSDEDPSLSSHEVPPRLASLRRGAALLLEMLQLRLELFSTELEAEKLRLLSVLTRILSALVLGLVGMALVMAALVMLVPEAWRWWVAGVAGLSCLGAAAALWLRALNGLVSEDGLFAATRAELRRDREGW